MRHVLLIHQAFVSPKEPGGTRHFEFARHLVEKGYKVTVVTSNLSYLTGIRTIGEVGLVTKEILDGIRLLRAYTYPTLHRGFVWRVISFFSFMFTSLIAAMRVKHIDLVMGTSPPIFQAVSAWLVSLLRHRPFLLEIRDLWPEFAIDLGVLKNPMLIRLSRWLGRFLYTSCNHLLVNSPAYRDYLINKGLPEHKITLIPNGVVPDMFHPEDDGKRIRSELGLNGQFVVFYTGALGLANDIPTILRAAERLRGRADVCFLLVGDGKERKNLEALAKEWNLGNVLFIGSRPKSEMPEILAASDACIAILQNIPMFRMTYPNKVFDYMAAGRPTILAIDGVIRQVVEAANGGIFVPPGDDESLAVAISRLAGNPSEGKAMGISARNYVEEHFNRLEQSNEFLKLVSELSQAKRRKVAYSRYGKRLFDLILSVSALVLLSPIFVLLALFILIKMGRPLFFVQKRPGLQGKPFTLLKFRTMNNTRDQHGQLLPDGQRLTRLGKFLRRTSMDELPELFNVMKGEMSLAGPRPLLMQYLERYTSEQARRHEVKPGITGWAQVNGRNAITWEQKFEHDVWYVDHLSFWLDLKIIALTVWRTMKREGINQPGQPTMEEFMGRSSE